MQQLDINQVKGLLSDPHEDFVLINVLAPDAFRDKHIRKSINIPLDDPAFVPLCEKIVGDKQRRVVVYCASFDCEAGEKAAEKLEQSGFTHVYDYAGGLKDWLDHRAAA